MQYNPSELDLIKQITSLIQNNNDEFCRNEIEKTLRRTRWVFTFHKFLRENVKFSLEIDEVNLKYYYEIYDIIHVERENIEYVEVPRKIKKALCEIFSDYILSPSKQITVKWEENLDYSFEDLIAVVIVFENHTIDFYIDNLF